MQKLLKTLFLILLSVASLSTNLLAETLQHNPQESANDKTKTIESLFRDYGIDGTFVIKLDSKTYIINQKRAATLYPPASTFKIYNSLFALDSRLVKNVDEIFYRYNGENVSFEVWRNDANLKNAMKFSQVPAFAQIARELGREKMQNYLNTLNFGNKKIGKLDYFWLDDSLKISALEQLELMDKLSHFALPFSKTHQKQVKSIIELEKGKDYALYAKSGLSKFDNSGVSWLVGFLEYKGNLYPFAFNANFASLQNYQKTLQNALKDSAKMQNPSKHKTNQNHTTKPQIPLVKECLEIFTGVEFKNTH